MDKVSIVIPTYNCAKYVIEAIESARKQTYPNREIIIVDDGSTDNTWELLMKKYNRISHLKLIHKKNGGTASALNAGIKAANGDWIHWLSADDVLAETALEHMMEEITKYPDAENSLFFSHYDYIDMDGNITGAFIEPDYNKWDRIPLEKELWAKFIGNGSSSMIHKKVFEHCGLFDESIFPCEDYEFWLRLVILNGVGFHLVPKVTLFYRIHSSQLTATWGEKSAPVIKRIRLQIYDQMTTAQKKIFAKPD